MLTVDIDDSEVRRAGTSFISALSLESRRALTAEAEATRARITGGTYWTSRTGKTAQSFRVEAGIETLGVSLTSGSKVARFLNDGTKAHAIAPRKASVLRFVANGRSIFARRVSHPGTKPRRFEQIEAASAEPRAATGVEAAAALAAQRAGLG
jgi:hypothetical protein